MLLPPHRRRDCLPIPLLGLLALQPCCQPLCRHLRRWASPPPSAPLPPSASASAVPTQVDHSPRCDILFLVQQRTECGAAICSLPVARNHAPRIFAALLRPPPPPPSASSAPASASSSALRLLRPPLFAFVSGFRLLPLRRFLWSVRVVSLSSLRGSLRGLSVSSSAVHRSSLRPTPLRQSYAKTQTTRHGAAAATRTITKDKTQNNEEHVLPALHRQTLLHATPAMRTTKALPAALLCVMTTYHDARRTPRHRTSTHFGRPYAARCAPYHSRRTCWQHPQQAHLA